MSALSIQLVIQFFTVLDGASGNSPKELFSDTVLDGLRKYIDNQLIMNF